MEDNSSYRRRFGDCCEVVDFVANGSFESLRNNVEYSRDRGFAVLVRLVDHSRGWDGDYVFVSEAAFKFLRKSVVHPGDVIIANVGANAGTVFRAPALSWPMTLGPNAVLCRPKSDEVSREFLHYLLISPAGQGALRSILSGSAQPKFNKTELRALYFDFPPKDKQLAIAHILGTLDDKIELNRRMNETLEEMARALFKSWFVDFDPVRAKAAGKRPNGMDEATAALFPDSFEESELGPIPRGWKTLSLYECATYINGAAYSAFQPNSERRGLPIIKIAELKAGITAQTKYSHVEMPGKYRLDNEDILFSWSGNPDTSIDTFVWSHGPAWLNQHVFRVKPRRETERPFLLALLKHLRPVFAELARNKQTTGLGHVTVGDLQRLTIAVPSEAGITASERILRPLQSRVYANVIESQMLAELRDSLLPKLLSGELRIDKAEKAVLEAV